MGTVVRTGSGVLVWVACLLLPFSATDTGPGVTQPEVDTPLGRVRGRQVGVKGTDRLVNVFLGIPFAQPPLGPHRFSAPRPAESWEGVRDASRAHAMCLQDLERMNNSRFTLDGKHQTFPISEDCLILNIYSPAEAPSGAGRPVMVWFHGGSLVTGTATAHDGSALAAYGDVVVVTVQYRLGFLGFFSTGDSQARGNWALLDQIAALRWVQKNIEAFGGDPGCVTLFGQSSGAMCISGLMTSPLARGLFHRAISQSGTAVFQIFITPDPLKVAKKIAQLAGCNHNSTKILVDCLRTLSGAEVMRVSQKMRFFKLHSQEDPQKIVWFMSPVVDGVVFQDNPIVLLTQGQVAPVPYLLGVNSLEFNWLLPFIMKFPMSHLRKETISKLLWSTSTLLNVTKEQLPLVMEEYLSDVDGHDQKMLQERVMDLAEDATFVYSTLQAARYHRNAGFPVYLYEFEHYAPGTIVKPRTDGADHGDEIGFIFGSPFSKGHSSSKEKALSLQMMKYWANFARSGELSEISFDQVTHLKLHGFPLFPETPMVGSCPTGHATTRMRSTCSWI
uniref:Carboxylic ester hydrolase n=1 Tax=Capra hircus TaxID=9925 RepID=A0A8C2PJ30_CAPHI